MRFNSYEDMKAAIEQAVTGAKVFWPLLMLDKTMVDV